LGHDFSGVRIRDDRSAAAKAHSLGAAAFTNGSEITFGQGAYAPHTAAGRHLLAHELSHVIQQGAAPPVAAAAPAAPPVSFTGRAPRTQLQDIKAVGGKWWERPDAVKKIVSEKDNTPGKEISKALDKNDLKGTQSLLRTEVIDGKTHEWRLTVRAEFLDRSALIPGQKYGETKPTVKYDLKRDKDEIKVHEIAIEVNKYLEAKAEDEDLYKPGNKARDEARVNFMAARTLYHEMLHALIQVDEESAKEGGSAQTTQATQGFEKMTSKLKTSARLSNTEQSVRQSISKVATAAEIVTARGDLFVEPGKTSKTRAEKIIEEAEADKLDKKYMDNLKAAAQAIPFANKSDEHVDFVEKTMEMLLEEKYARKTTGEAFGLKEYQENSKLADDYVAQVENTLLKLGRAKTGRDGLKFAGNVDYDREFSTLHTNVQTMYNLIDTEPAAAQGVGPRMFGSPEMLPKPITLEEMSAK
jgi:hypothetical protein